VLICQAAADIPHSYFWPVIEPWARPKKTFLCPQGRVAPGKDELLTDEGRVGSCNDKQLETAHQLGKSGRSL
jgi:hypothetical protein